MVISPMAGVIKLDACAVAAALKTAVDSGREAVCAWSASLEELAERCTQPGAMHGLAYLLESEYLARKRPRLVRFADEHGRLQAAVLVFEYKVGPWGTGVMATGDSFGVRTVIAPDMIRLQVARRACALLVEQGASLVLLSLKDAPSKDAAGLPFLATGATDQGEDRLWAMRTRTVRDSLPLAGTVEETLARLGKRTRTHLRYYRRRLETAVPHNFVADAGAWIDGSDGEMLAALNRGSLDPLRQATFDLAVRSALSSPGGFVSGLRAAGGGKDCWLSLVGGWRQGTTTWVQWQMNASGYQDLSVGTALRACLIEEEVRRGCRRLAFHGGTSHSMSHSFAEERVIDMIFTGAGLPAATIARWVPRLYRAVPSLAERGNFMGDALSGSDLRWLTAEELDAAFEDKAGRTALVG